MKTLLKISAVGILCLTLLLLHRVETVQNVYAQEPTPRPLPGGGGTEGSGTGTGSGGRSTPIPPKTGLYGYVYNYTSAANEPGITVIAKGDGWGNEAVTDSNGYYHIGDLGFGQGVVNLQLPAGVNPAAPDWPVLLSEEGGHQLNLGFYWDDEDPPIPVRLSGAASGNRLTIQVENRTAETATGGHIEIISPASMRISPVIQASQGQTDYAAHRSTVSLGDIAPDNIVTINVSLIPTGVSTSLGQMAQPVQLFFTYNQQITPQSLQFNVSAPLFETSMSSETAQEFSPAQPADSSAATTAPAAQLPVAADKTQPGAETEGDTPPSQAEKISPLPTTGDGPQSTNLVILILAALLVLGLGIGGWHSIRAKR